MFIETSSLQVKTPGMANFIQLGQYLVEAKYGYYKIWSKDSGRNLAGTQSGTLLGIFPKIIVTFRRLTKEELEIIAPIIDSASQVIRYYDPNKKAYVTMTTYTGDYEITNKHIISATAKNEGFTCSFISVRRRS